MESTPEELIDCRNAIENIGLVDDMSCASVKRKTMSNKTDNTDSVALQNGDHWTQPSERGDNNQKIVLNGNVCKCDEEVINHFDVCSDYSVNSSSNNIISDNINSNSVNEDFNDSEAVVVTEEIGIIEVITEEQVICENPTEEESDSHTIRTNVNIINDNINENSVCDEEMCDSEVRTVISSKRIDTNRENSNGNSNALNAVNACNRFVPSLDFDGENSSLSESSSQQSQHSSASQPTPSAVSSNATSRTTSAASVVHSTFAITSTHQNMGSDNSQLNDSTNVSSVSVLNKKKFGKFRILNDEQNRTTDDACEPIQHSEDTCIDSTVQEFDREKAVCIETMSTQSESSLHENSEHSSASPNPSNDTPNKSSKQTKRRGRPAGSTKKDKISVQMPTQILLDDEDISRRRSSRLKTLEARKEQEKAYCKHRDLDETSGDSSIVNTSDANESQHSVTESSIITKQKKKKSKKDKNKSKEKNREKEEKESKKGKRKKKLFANNENSNNENLFDQHLSEKCKTSDIHKCELNSQCFTPPLPPQHYANIKSNPSLTPPSSRATIDSDETSPRPEKVKSRWRRNSELESGHGFNGDHQRQSAQTVPIIIPKETETPPNFDAIDDNIYLFERRKSKSKKETRRMVCDCILTKEERMRGLIGCGDDCLNRMLMIECGSRCSLGEHCANKRFQKKQCAKVEPFRTAKKGWGLRTLEPLQPNTFIMEYIGEVIDPLDFHNRTQKYSKEKREHHYFMALKSDEIIDATVKGNITRFVNHSCDPNSETQKWTVNGELRIGFFSQRYIEAGEEITFDYQFQRYGKEAQKCLCDSMNCRGYIGATESVDILTDGSRITPKQKSLSEEMAEEVNEEEVLEDLALEEEIAKLSEGGGLRNRQQVLMLARLMVRAEDTVSRIKLINIIKGTVEIAYLRLLLDYHGLQLIWSWMVEVEDSDLKAEILELLEILPIPNKTMLTDSKVYSVVERWSQQTNEDIVKSTNGSNSMSSIEPNLNSTIVSAKVEETPSVEAVVPPESPSVEAVVPPESPSVEAVVPPESPSVEAVVPPESPSVEAVVPPESPSVEAVVPPESPSIEAVVPQESPSVETMVPPESLEPNDSQSSDVISVVKTEPIEEQKAEQMTESLNNICSTTQSEDSAQLEGTEDSNQLEVVSKNESEVQNEDSEQMEENKETNEKSSLRIELKCSSLSLVIKPRSVPNAPKAESPQTMTPVIKAKPSIASLAQKLLLNWKELKEVFRIPRLERQKRHEDEKEADRKTKEVEERRARGLPVSYDKRGADDRDYTIAGILGIRRKGIKRTNDSKDTSNKKSSNTLSQIMSSSFSKVSKEEHRKMFEAEVAQKDYQEALKRYHQELAYYNAVYGHQLQAHQQQQQQQQQQYSQETQVREQYANTYSAYEQYYQSDQNYLQPSVNYSAPTEASVEYMSEETQQFVEYSEDNASADDNVMFGMETSASVLIPLANLDWEPMAESQSPLAIDSVPNDMIVYGDQNLTKSPTLEDQNSIFDSTYPPPGVFYVTPDGSNYFTPLPVDRKERSINLVFENNITVPLTPDTTKCLTTKLPHNWGHNRDKNGNIYYYNKTKRKSQWIAPEEDKHISPVIADIEVPIDVNTDQKLSDTEESTPGPEIPSLITSPKLEETEEPIDSFLASTAPDSMSFTAEPEAVVTVNNSPQNLLQTILALEADPRRRRQMLNSVVPSTTTAAADTSSNRKKSFSSTRQIQEYFRNKMSEYVVHCLNPYRKPDCKKGRILNNNDFKYLARKLTHTIMGKEIKQCKSLENLSCNEAVKHKTKDYVKKYMARFGPFYKTENTNDRMVSPKDIVANDSND